jgi:hypothetical protein
MGYDRSIHAVGTEGFDAKLIAIVVRPPIFWDRMRLPLFIF